MFIWYFGCIYYIHFNKTTVYSHASISVRLYLEMLNANISTLTMPMFWCLVGLMLTMLTVCYRANILELALNTAEYSWG